MAFALRAGAQSNANFRVFKNCISEQARRLKYLLIGVLADKEFLRHVKELFARWLKRLNRRQEGEA